MHYIKRFLTLLIIASLLLCVAFVAFRLMLWLDSAEPLNERSEKETRSNVHWLDETKPLTFSFSNSRTHAIRVLSNAVFEQKINLDKPVNYAIEYSVFDQQDNLIKHHIYHHASKMTLANEQEQVKQIIENKSAMGVASGQSFYIPIEQLANAHSVQLKLIPEDSTLTGVVVRVHAKTPNDSLDALSSWLKIPTERRMRALSYLSVGENTLTVAEINNAVMYNWQKIAPQGIPQVDFKADILYESLPYNVVTYDFSQQQLDLGSYYTDSSLCSSVRINYTDSLIFSASNAQVPLQLTWHDALQFQAPRAVTYQSLSDTEFITEALNPGLLIICSDSAQLTRWRFNSNERVLTSQETVYEIDQGNSAQFTIQGNSHIKLNLRSVTANQIAVRVLDKNMQTIETFNTMLAGEISKFDRFIDDTTQRIAAPEAVNYYLRTPASAHHIVINATSAALISLESRSEQFNYQRLISYTPQPLSEEFDIAAWYQQKADNHFSLLEKDKVHAIRAFTQPADIEYVDTYYQSRDLEKQLTISNVALIKSPTRYYSPVREASLFNYGPITKNQLASTLYALKQPLQHAVVYKNTSGGANEASLRDLARTELDTVLANAGKIYQNWQGERNWNKQRVYKLSKNTPLTLHFAESLPISVVLKIYNRRSTVPINVSMRVSADYKKTLTSEYTIATRNVQLHPTQKADAFLIHPKNNQLTSYPSVTLPIASDIKRLKSITVTADETVWLSILDEFNHQQQDVRWWNE